MKLIKLIIILVGCFSIITGCKTDKPKEKIVNIDGKEIITVESDNLVSTENTMKDLSVDQMKKFKNHLKEAEVFIRKYSNEENYLNAKNLDDVLGKWIADKSSSKKDKEKVVEMIGCAFGQDIINDFDFEWQILTDEYGTDFTVIHKEFKINGFPFSSVEKAIEQNRKGSLENIKLVLKNNINKALQEADVQKRKNE